MRPVGVSRCLLGDKVRHDGGDKAEPALIDALRRRFELVPFCPEVDAGMGVPREPVNLVEDSEGTRLIGALTGKDCTEMMSSHARAAAEEFAERGIGGLVLKSGSPSCALSSAALCRRDGSVLGRSSAGFFTRTIREMLPRATMAEETTLRNRDELGKFTAKVTAFGE
ncbi:MAG: DUF523 domain-containing protein [Candidatus Nitrospinota bacterium M3_3B_026]